jgi:DNA recombination protein RmuC
MEIFLIILLSILVISLTIIILKSKKNKSENDLVSLLLNSINEERKGVSDRLEKIETKLFQGLNETNKTAQTQFIQNKDLIKEISEELVKVKETNKQVLAFSEKLQKLENILGNPKSRGVLGEFYLETLLSNILPKDLYKMQYKFKNNEIVDAVIFFQDKLIPIDSKFSLEKFSKIEEETDPVKKLDSIKKFNIDLKNRIEETSKYIRPEENTSEFAFMFIPAEGIYYSILNYNNPKDNLVNGDLMAYAFKKHVIIVSPISFYAYLQTVLQGLKSLKVEKSVQEIIKKLLVLSKDIEKYEDNFNKLGKQLETTVKTYNTASTRFKKIDKDIYEITDAKNEKLLSPYTIEQ